MRNQNTFVKLFVSVFITVTVVIVLTGAFTHWQVNKRYQQDTRQSQDRLARVATEHFEEMWPLEPARVDEICKKLLHDPAHRLTVIAADGAVLGDSDADPRKMANHKTADRPEVLAALAGQPGSQEHRSATLGVPFRYVARPLMQNGAVVGAVRLAVPMKAVAEGEAYVRNAVLWSVAAGAAAAVLLSLLTAWAWSAPLRRLTETMRQIGSGDLSPQAGPLSSVRLAELAQVLDDLRDNLGQHLSQIASRDQDFQAVLSGLDEGVVATDLNERVVVMNRAAGDLLAIDAGNAVGKQLGAVLNSMEMLELDEQALAAEAPLRRMLEIDTPKGRRRLEIIAKGIAPGTSSVRCLLLLREAT
jgi:two-component system, OmpR family, phosphate regulon sensor histidine kinase PhoR